MFIGACRMTLAIPGNRSLKGKRSVVRKLVARTGQRFNVSIAEIASQDVLDRAVIGFAVVSGESAHTNRMVDEVVTFLSGIGEAELLDRSMEIIPIGAVVSSEEGDRLRWSDFEDTNGA